MRRKVRSRKKSAVIDKKLGSVPSEIKESIPIEVELFLFYCNSKIKTFSKFLSKAKGKFKNVMIHY